jgi:hypothetical protein
VPPDEAMKGFLTIFESLIPITNLSLFPQKPSPGSLLLNDVKIEVD